MSILFYKLGLTVLPPNGKVMENINFKLVYIGTMILCSQVHQKYDRSV